MACKLAQRDNLEAIVYDILGTRADVSHWGITRRRKHILV